MWQLNPIKVTCSLPQPLQLFYRTPFIARAIDASPLFNFGALKFTIDLITNCSVNINFLYRLCCANWELAYLLCWSASCRCESIKSACYSWMISPYSPHSFYSGTISQLSFIAYVMHRVINRYDKCKGLVFRSAFPPLLDQKHCVVVNSQGSSNNLLHFMFYSIQFPLVGDYIE